MDSRFRIRKSACSSLFKYGTITFAEGISKFQIKKLNYTDIEGTVEKWLFYTISCCDIQSVTAYIVGDRRFPAASFTHLYL